MRLVGVGASIVGAIVFYILAAYSLTRKNRDTSHHLFAAFAICIGSSQWLAFFEFITTKEFASILLRFDLTFLIFGAYHYILFADYFREGLNKKFMFIFGLPAALIAVMVFTIMIKAVVWGPYGWAGAYYLIPDLIYDAYGLLCVIISTYMFFNLWKVVDDTLLRKKMGFFVAGSLIALIGSLVNAAVIVLIGRIFPIIETTLLVTGILFAMGLARR